MTLENVSADHLRQVLEQIEEAAASERVMAAITYKEFDDVTQKDAAELYGYSEGWASKWFNRLERLETEPFEAVVYDEPREGRPTELSDKQHEQFVEALNDPPEEAGYDAPAWTVGVATLIHVKKSKARRHISRGAVRSGSQSGGTPDYRRTGGCH